MNELALFNYGDKTVRTVILEGQIWFVAKDVADILEFRDAYNATQCLEDNEKGTCKVSTLRGEQEMLIINEPGIYRLIFRSNKPEAKAFQDWVYHDVLPTLHHKGSFTIGQVVTPAPVDPMQVAKVVFEAARIEDNQLALALDKVGKHYTGESMLALAGITLIAPVKEQHLTPTQIGKFFKLNARKINQLLVDNGYQVKIGNGYEPTELGAPFAVMLDVGKGHGNGTPIRQLKWNSGILEEISDLV